MVKSIARILVVTSLLIALSIALLAVLMHPKPRILFFGGAHSAEAKLPTGMSIRVQMAPVFLTHLAEYERRLKVCDNSFFGCTSKWLIVDTGGHRKINLYRHTSGSIIIVDSIWMMEVEEDPKIRILSYQEEKEARLRERDWNCRKEETGPLAEREAPNSLYFKNLKYLGTFEFFTRANELAGSVRFSDFKFLSSEHYGEQLCRYPSRG